MLINATPEELSKLLDQHEKLKEVCKKLSKLKTGPTEAKRGEWTEIVLALAEQAREALKNS